MNNQKLPEELHPKVYLYKRIVQAKLFIDTNYGDKIDIDAVAGEGCFSKFHFTRLFKQIYHKTPHQYLTAVRIDHAKLLLQQGEAVKDVCFAVGFESLSSFSSLFKKNTGLPPSAFMAQAQDRKQQIAGNPLHFISGCFAHQFGWTRK